MLTHMDREISVVLPPVHSEVDCQVYKIRWFILLLFAMYSMSNGFQWIQYSVITRIICNYYQVPEHIVDMTSTIYMITYIPLIFPATYLLEKKNYSKLFNLIVTLRLPLLYIKGLRVAVLLGSFGTAVGTWIKVFSTSPSLFWLAFLGQTIVAISQIFILGIPPALAAVWFGPNQVSTATSMGVFGNQMGIALGFLLPPMFVRNGTQEEIGHDLRIMNYGTGAVTTILFILITMFFKDKPATPPSLAQVALLTAKEKTYVSSMKRLFTNRGYILLLISYGMNGGVYYAISTLLSTFILKYFEGHVKETGGIGFALVAAGMIGAMISGVILDKTKKFKETTVILYFLSMIGMIVYTFTLPNAGNIVLLYIVFSALGFFMTGYLPVGFEFAAEITYPESEGTSSGLLNASAQVFGFIFVPLIRILFESKLGAIGANLALVVVLFIGFIMTCLIKTDLKRTAAQKSCIQPTNQYKN